MSRFSEIARIYDHRLPQLRSPEVWEQTLRMTSSFWRLNFCEAMLLTLQNPKAEMCGTIDQWNNIGRYIRRGEHSTAVFRSRTSRNHTRKFDVIVGNVPFGDFKPYDPEYDEYLIHDYFFAKSIDNLKPGGIMALITSAGTLDKYDDSFRRELSGKADFLGGVRLPEDAFRTAGTQTVTDILFFQKLEFEHENDSNSDWVRSERVYGEASVFQENRYFRQNPEMVLGTPEIVPGRFGNTRTIKSDGNTAERLSEAISRLDGHFSAEPTIDDELPKEEYGDIPDGVTPYTYYVSGGSLYYAENRSAVPFTGSSEPRIKAMCSILDRLNEVTAAQKKGCSDDELKMLQSRLNNAYDGFVKKYGHLNGRTNISAFADDIRAPRLTSIEKVAAPQR